MIVKILQKSPNFGAVRYSTDKVNKTLGELLRVRNFGILEVLEDIRPQDYINYLLAISATNKNVKYPQFHVAISTKGQEHTKEELSLIAEQWMEGMGYGHQPYLIIYHGDTHNRHVHIVSTRVGKDGKKISDSFERIRAYEVLNKIVNPQISERVLLDIRNAMTYKFSNTAQFSTLLETQGYTIIHKDDQLAVCKYGKQLTAINILEVEKLISADCLDKKIKAQLREIISSKIALFDRQLYKTTDGCSSQLCDYLNRKFGLQFIFHSNERKIPYGYTLIDHKNRAVYKGSEIIPLRILADFDGLQSGKNKPDTGQVMDKPSLQDPLTIGTALLGSDDFNISLQEHLPSTHATTQEPVDILDIIPEIDIQIANDIDDEAILGRNRRKKQKARTNTR